MLEFKALYTAKEVAQHLNIALSTVYAYAENGQLRAVFLPQIRASQAQKRNKRCVRFRLADIKAFLDNMCVGASSINQVR